MSTSYEEQCRTTRTKNRNPRKPSPAVPPARAHPAPGVTAAVSGVPQEGQYTSVAVTMCWHLGQLGLSLWLQCGQKLKPLWTKLPHCGQALRIGFRRIK